MPERTDGLAEPNAERLEPPPKEAAVRVVHLTVERPAIGLAGLGRPAELTQQLGPGRPVEMPGFDPGHALEECQTGGGTEHLGLGHGPVHPHDRAGCHPLQRPVEVHDLLPVGLGVGVRIPMEAGDGRLYLIGTGTVSSQAPFDEVGRFLDGRSIPERAVLIGEENEIAVAI